MADIERSGTFKKCLTRCKTGFYNNYASLRSRKIKTMKKAFLNISFLLAMLISMSVSAQDLMIKNDGGKVYLEHKVAAKEGLYGIGRNYNVHPTEIAAFNNMDINKGLNLGQIIRVPLTENNFSQTAATGSAVYYKVGEKEGLYRVGINSNNTIDNIKKLNRLNSENVSVGTKLIVGYLIAGDPFQTVAKAEEKTEPAKPVVAVIKEEKKPEPKVEIVKPEPVKPVAVKEEKRQEPKAEMQKPEPIKQTVTSVAGNGYFKNDFDAQIKEQPLSKDITVTSGIFKTISGWQDGKYYMLIDDVEPGSIVKITNPSNGKMIYAKVLGKMNGIRQNQGLNIRISNAAASVLEVDETDKFIVTANY